MKKVNINTIDIKEKNRANYLRSDKKHDHGTSGNVRTIKDSRNEFMLDHRGVERTDGFARTEAVSEGLDDYYVGMTPYELTLEADKILADEESASIKAEQPRQNADLFELPKEVDIIAELMGSNVAPADIARRALHRRNVESRKHFDEN
ncbi:MAG: hypothetical protein JWM07_451 [Candidatus Saccharibacteria bacterium]|nr:hypothetical protein [Candidatus Saccharibacteria bacterium]